MTSQLHVKIEHRTPIRINAKSLAKLIHLRNELSKENKSIQEVSELLEERDGLVNTPTGSPL